MTGHDLAVLLILGVLLTALPLVRSLAAQVRIPAPILYILLGFFLRAADAQYPFLDGSSDAVFSMLGELGVVALLFRVGLRSRLQDLLAKLPSASLIWFVSVVVALVSGAAVAYYPLGLGLPAALVIAVAFSASSVALSVAVWDESGLLRSGTGSLLIDIAELDDLSAVLLLAILLSVLPLLANGDSNLLTPLAKSALSTLAQLCLFIALCYLFSHFLEARFSRFSREKGGSDSAFVIAILGVGLLISALAGFLGFSLAIGALFAGLAFSRDPEVVRNEGGFSYFYDFFAPFFFINIGLQVEPDAVAAGLELGLALFVAAVAGKLIGVTLPALLVVDRRDALLLGVSMVPRAEIALLVAYQCSVLDSGALGADVFAAVVVATMLTAISAPPLVRGLLRRAQSSAS